MANGRSRTAVELPGHHDYREANKLKLGAEHIPFPCSLRELVLDRYGEPPGERTGAHAMQPEELLEYLSNIDNFNISPWIAIVEQTEAMGDPATPSPEHAAILQWLSKALEMWEKQFPLEGRLATQTRRLKPLFAALAITDAEFMQPGAHPLHQLLDSIQARGVGWQSRLARVGAILEQQVTDAVNDSREWFADNATDLSGICHDFTVAAERDNARAQRMVLRVVETEAGKVKTAAAKLVAAQMINAALEKSPAPFEIGGFLKGPWYDSAQLLLLKFGVDSEQWQKMTHTTDTLLDSLQSLEGADETRRQHIFEVVTQLPKEMRRWLLSMHHDTEAVNEAIGLIEFAHLRILRRQPLDPQPIAAIDAEGAHAAKGELQHTNAQRNWQEGQWFALDNGADGIVRVQMVLKIEQSQQLLFTNLAGLKVLQLSYEEFGRMLDKNKVSALYTGASFSLCLAKAAGIESVEVLEALVGALGVTESESEPVPDPDPIPELEPDTEQKSEIEIEPDPEASPATANAALEHVGQTAPRQQSPADQSNEPGDIPYSDQQGAVEGEPTQDEGSLVVPPDSPKLEEGFLAQQAVHLEASPRQFIEDTAEDTTDKPGSDFLSSPASEANDETPLSADPVGTQKQELNLPTGTWIGFHDGETPLLARLAVHDQEDGHFIFVNRNGVKMRQLSRQELLGLIDRGLVDIVETNTNFRTEVSEARKNLDES
jgi:hypothetical protein